MGLGGMWLCSKVEARDNRVTQADPGPGNSVLPQWNRPLHGRRHRKLALRAWCLVFITLLATVMLLSVLDGRMAYLHGS